MCVRNNKILLYLTQLATKSKYKVFMLNKSLLVSSFVNCVRSRRLFWNSCTIHASSQCDHTVVCPNDKTFSQTVLVPATTFFRTLLPPWFVFVSCIYVQTSHVISVTQSPNLARTSECVCNFPTKLVHVKYTYVVGSE